MSTEVRTKIFSLNNHRICLLMLFSISSAILHSGEVIIENKLGRDIVALPIVYKNNSSNIKDLLNNLDAIIPANTYPVVIKSNWQIGFTNIVDKEVYDRENIGSAPAKTKQLLPNIKHWPLHIGHVNGTDGGGAVHRWGLFELKKLFPSSVGPEKVYEIPAYLKRPGTQTMVINESNTSPVTVTILKDNGGKPQIVRSVQVEPHNEIILDGTYLRISIGKQTIDLNEPGIRRWLVTDFGVYFSQYNVSVDMKPTPLK